MESLQERLEQVMYFCLYAWLSMFLAIWNLYNVNWSLQEST